MVSGSSLKSRQIGRSGPMVSCLGLGCMSLSGAYGAYDDASSLETMRYALDCGVTLLDTADSYGAGHSEDLVGRAVRGRRDQVVIATKFGRVRTASQEGVSGRPEYVQQACEASLRRLGIDTIDIYFQHRVDPDVPIEETVGAMAKLVKNGKVRYLGLSEARPETIRRAMKVHPIVAVETEFSLLYRLEAQETLQTTRELGIGFVAYAPLGRGLLTGSIRDQSQVAGTKPSQHPRFMPGNFEENRALVEGVESLAREKNCTPSQLVLAWLLMQGDDIVPIPGTKRRQHIDENLGSLHVSLTPEDVVRIGQAIPPGAAAGDRYPAAAMREVYR